MRTWREYKASLPEAEQLEIERQAQELILTCRLEQLRKARKVSQRQLAEAVGVSQPAIAKMEREKDMKLSTLKRLAEGMGGVLKVEFEFPEGVSHRITV